MDRRRTEFQGWLAFCRIRAVYPTLLAIATTTVAGWAVGGREFRIHQESDFAIPWLILLPLVSACAIVMSVDSAVTGWEIASPRPIGRMVSGYAALLTAVAALGITADTAGLAAPYSLPTALRNLIGFVGSGLVCGRVLGARLSWLAPMVWALASVTVGSGTDGAGVTRVAAWAWPILPDTGTATVSVASLMAGTAFLLFAGLVAACRLPARFSRGE